MPDSEVIFAVQASPEGGYEARARGFSIFTQAETFKELHTMIRDAISCHFGAELPYKVVENPRSSAQIRGK
jgi:predicted RNase H-like HicB family nuclease